LHQETIVPHYCIEAKKPNGEANGLRIVEAKNQARALSHVVEDTLTVRLADPLDYVKLTKAGHEIEQAE
jgi:Mn-dependent DtxR family transcriptional regulator